MVKMIITHPKDSIIANDRGTGCPTRYRLFIRFVSGRSTAAVTNEKTRYMLISEKYRPSKITSIDTSNTFNTPLFIAYKNTKKITSWRNKVILVGPLYFFKSIKGYCFSHTYVKTPNNLRVSKINYDSRYFSIPT